MAASGPLSHLGCPRFIDLLAPDSRPRSIPTLCVPPQTPCQAVPTPHLTTAWQPKTSGAAMPSSRGNCTHIRGIAALRSSKRHVNLHVTAATRRGAESWEDSLQPAPVGIGWPSSRSGKQSSKDNTDQRHFKKGTDTGRTSPDGNGPRRFTGGACRPSAPGSVMGPVSKGSDLEWMNGTQKASLPTLESGINESVEYGVEDDLREDMDDDLEDVEEEQEEEGQGGDEEEGCDESGDQDLVPVSVPASSGGNGISPSHLAGQGSVPQDTHQGKDTQLHSAAVDTGGDGSSGAPLEPVAQVLDVKAAKALLKALSRYRPQSPTERRWQLSRIYPYDPQRYEAAANAVAAHPEVVLDGVSLQGLAYIVSGYATAQHPPHTGMMAAVGAAVAGRMTEWATKAAAAAAAGSSPLSGSDLGDGGRYLTLRSAAAVAMGYARLGVRSVPLFAALSAWLKGAIRGGALRPKAKAQGLWLSVLMWAFASLRLYDKRLWAEVSLLLQSHAMWPTLLDANDTLRLVWACRSVRHEDPTLMYLLQRQATTQVGKLSMLDLGHAWSTLAAASWAPTPLLQALAKACQVKVNSLQPPVLTSTLVSLALLHQQQRLRGPAGSRQQQQAAAGLSGGDGQQGLPDEALRELLDSLVVWASNKMMNFTPTEAAASLHALACLRYRNNWAMAHSCMVLAHDKWDLLGGMSMQQLVVVAQALATLDFHNQAVIAKLVRLLSVHALWKEDGLRPEIMHDEDLIRTGGDPPGAAPASASASATAAAAAASEQGGVSPRQLVVVLEALTRLRHLDPPFCSLAATYVLRAAGVALEVHDTILGHNRVATQQQGQQQVHAGAGSGGNSLASTTAASAVQQEEQLSEAGLPHTASGRAIPRSESRAQDLGLKELKAPRLQSAVVVRAAAATLPRKEALELLSRCAVACAEAGGAAGGRAAVSGGLHLVEMAAASPAAGWEADGADGEPRYRHRQGDEATAEPEVPTGVLQYTWPGGKVMHEAAAGGTVPSDAALAWLAHAARGDLLRLAWAAMQLGQPECTPLLLAAAPLLISREEGGRRAVGDEAAVLMAVRLGLMLRHQEQLKQQQGLSYSETPPPRSNSVKTKKVPDAVYMAKLEQRARMVTTDTGSSISIRQSRTDQDDMMSAVSLDSEAGREAWKVVVSRLESVASGRLRRHRQAQLVGAGVQLPVLARNLEAVLLLQRKQEKATAEAPPRAPAAVDAAGLTTFSMLTGDPDKLLLADLLVPAAKSPRVRGTRAGNKAAEGVTPLGGEELVSGRAGLAVMVLLEEDYVRVAARTSTSAGEGGFEAAGRNSSAFSPALDSGFEWRSDCEGDGNGNVDEASERGRLSEAADEKEADHVDLPLTVEPHSNPRSNAPSQMLSAAFPKRQLSRQRAGSKKGGEGGSGTMVGWQLRPAMFLRLQMLRDLGWKVLAVPAQEWLQVEGGGAEGRLALLSTLLRRQS